MGGERPHFARRLQELREAAGLSRPELAQRAGIRSLARIRNLEQGLTSPDRETVRRLALALGVPGDAFEQPLAVEWSSRRRGRLPGGKRPGALDAGAPAGNDSGGQQPAPGAEQAKPKGRKKT